MLHVRCLLAGILAALSIAASQAAPAEPRLEILVYHEIRDGAQGPADGPTAISLSRFASQMRYLHERGYATLSTAEVVDFIKGVGALPAAKAVAIHFDDGWKSAQLALPVLERYRFKATFWIFPGAGIGWPYMDWAEVSAIARNPRFEVLSHTMTHPWKDGDTLLDWLHGRTPGKGVEQARWELAESRRVLEQKLRHPVHYLAWPRGLYDDTLIRLATDAGYAGLFTIDDGFNERNGDVLRIRRTMINGACDDLAFVRILADGKYRDCSAAAKRPQDGEDQARGRTPRTALDLCLASSAGRRYSAND